MSHLKLLLLLSFLFISVPVAAEDLPKEVQRLKLEVSTLEIQVQTLSTKLASLETLQEEHEAILKKLIGQIWELERRVGEARSSGNRQ